MNINMLQSKKSRDTAKNLYQFHPGSADFISHEAIHFQSIYFPLCGITSDSLKSSITPFLSGDIKVDKNRFLTKPVSVEDLRYDVRNFFVYIKDEGVFSLADGSKESSTYVECGPLWHKLVKKIPSLGLEFEALNFIPVTGEHAELMRVMVKNTGSKPFTIIPTASIPIFARALANKHDHEHVTSLLNRITQSPRGVMVEPTMIFNEEGHKDTSSIYYVFGSMGDTGEGPVGTFPTLESFYGTQGNSQHPQAVFENLSPPLLETKELDGKEAMGALRFQTVELKPGDSKEYILVIGVVDSQAKAEDVFDKFDSSGKIQDAWAQNKNYWTQRSQAVSFFSRDNDFNQWMHWVTLQPVFRRIFGCSFLPDHDYGKGGRGWRDLWQDLLTLILTEPQQVRSLIIQFFAGVRIDGTNATIIGEKPGEFVADRNTITRVWMDHGIWPLWTLLLYIHQTGDYDILFESAPYFRDPQLTRTLEKDFRWSPQYGNKLKDREGNIYHGTILEHVLIEHLVQFFNVGEHNIIRLENADWNDGLDMAFHRGESVAFTNFYAGNILILADLLEHLSLNGKQTIEILKETEVLLDKIQGGNLDYTDVEAKKKLLLENYCPSVQPEVSGEKISLKIAEVIRDLRQKGEWMTEHIRKQEIVEVKYNKENYRWFNGYYDNKAERVDGEKDGKIRMTLTGQVFPILSGVAGDEEIKNIVKSVNHFLRDKELGGIRMNTDFGLRNYLDLGRAFGFAYGTKENGSFFSHLNVMYAYALYKRGFVREGYEVLNSIYTMARDSGKSRIYPGIPEYFDAEGRGRYHFLTGSASWLVFTQLTQVFGVRGEKGDLIISPKLVREQFNEKGEAAVSFLFCGKRLTVNYINNTKDDMYTIKSIVLNNHPVEFDRVNPKTAKIKKDFLKSQPNDIHIHVTLEKS